jgi:4'-phosphopantetheinyl transferase
MDLRLSREQIHIWSSPLGASEALLITLWRLLSRDERERALRFHFPRHRDAFALSRGLLRLLLSRYTGQPPQSIEFAYGVKGKPRLWGHRINSQRPPIEFNLSHCADRVVYAFALDCAVGVDVERLRPIADAEQIAEHLFSPSEWAEISIARAEQRHRSFFNCWTRKEAVLKAFGCGLSIPLDSFQVSLRPGQPAKLLTPLLAGEKSEDWNVRDLDLSPGYVGAVAFKAQNRDLYIYSFTTVGGAFEAVCGFPIGCLFETAETTRFSRARGHQPRSG